jgi:hypothetical protein
MLTKLLEVLLLNLLVQKVSEVSPYVRIVHLNVSDVPIANLPLFFLTLYNRLHILQYVIGWYHFLPGNESVFLTFWAPTIHAILQHMSVVDCILLQSRTFQSVEVPTLLYCFKTLMILTCL